MIEEAKYLVERYPANLRSSFNAVMLGVKKRAALLLVYNKTLTAMYFDVMKALTILLYSY